MSKDGAQFVFMTCRAGAEGAVKEEVARIEPAWRLSFSRPGFLTFKHTGDRPLDDRRLAERNWTFAHAHGISLGRLTGERLEELAAEVWRHESVATLAAQSGIADVHVWERELPEAVDVGNKSAFTPLCQEIDAALRAAAPESLRAGGLIPPGRGTRDRGSRRLASDETETTSRRKRPAPRNGRVLDIIVLEPGQWWIGHHRAVRRHERWPGGAIPVRSPNHAVSRAYAKMEEAIQWSGLPLAAGDECVEIGCAPGGASQALLDRGLFVTGIDPAVVDPAVLEHPRFRHLKKRGKDVRLTEFEGVRWLVADMNIAPEATLDEVEAIITHRELTIRGMILTLKLSDWKLAGRLPELAARVHGWGYREVRMRQLVTGGQEVCLVALRRKALRRLGGKLSRKRKRRSLKGSRRDAPHPTLPGPHF